MNLSEAAELLQLNKNEVKIAIEQGIELPKSHTIVRLQAELINDSYEIDDDCLDSFIKRFHDEDPGRHPPVAVRRQLLVEARHSCAICKELTPIEFHHILEYSKVKHYDVRYMLALCPNHHTLCTNGTIDQKSQFLYKRMLSEQNSPEMNSEFVYSLGPANFSWDDLRKIIVELHSSLVAGEENGESKYDFTMIDIEKKNQLNLLSEEYYKTVVLRHEPYFERVSSFLSNPINSDVGDLYYQIVDEIRSKIALSRDNYERFELFLSTFADIAVKDLVDGRSRYRRTLNILMSFMYVNCDIGRKQ